MRTLLTHSAVVVNRSGCWIKTALSMEYNGRGIAILEVVNDQGYSLEEWRVNNEVHGL